MNEPKKDEVKEKGETQEITDEIQLITKTVEVHSSVKDNISEDYTLAFLNKDEREYITENFRNAKFAKSIISRFAEKGYYYKWDESKFDWVRDEEDNPKRIYLTKEQKAQIENGSKKLFEFFMVQPHLIAILNRNKVDNFLVKLLGKYNEDEKPIMYEKEDRNILQKIKDKMFGGSEEDGD